MKPKKVISEIYTFLEAPTNDASVKVGQAPLVYIHMQKNQGFSPSSPWVLQKRVSEGFPTLWSPSLGYAEEEACRSWISSFNRSRNSLGDSSGKPLLKCLPYLENSTKVAVSWNQRDSAQMQLAPHCLIRWATPSYKIRASSCES